MQWWWPQSGKSGCQRCLQYRHLYVICVPEANRKFSFASCLNSYLFQLLLEYFPLTLFLTSRPLFVLFCFWFTCMIVITMWLQENKKHVSNRDELTRLMSLSLVCVWDFLFVWLFVACVCCNYCCGNYFLC